MLLLIDLVALSLAKRETPFVRLQTLQTLQPMLPRRLHTRKEALLCWGRQWVSHTTEAPWLPPASFPGKMLLPTFPVRCARSERSRKNWHLEQSTSQTMFTLLYRICSPGPHLLSMVLG